MKSTIQDLIKQSDHEAIQDILMTQTELSKTDIHQLIGFAEYNTQNNIVSILQEAEKGLMQDKSTSTYIEYSQKDLQQNKNGVATKLGLHKRSVTPTTLEKIIFDDSEEDLFYKEIYTHKDNSVTRFAFNEQLLPYEKFTDSKKLDSWKSSTKSVAAIKINADRIKLHELESDLLAKAIGYLEYSQQKTVIIDIFARDQGKIKDDSGLVELHSVVLFKSNAKIYVIDPSNFSFSCHLSNFNADLIITKYSTDKLYEPPSGKSEIGKKLVDKYKSITGSSSDQYRDCIDIAVKIAFSINTKLDIDLDNITKLDAIQEISNQQEINLNLPFSSNVAGRIKQATDNDVRKLTNKLLVNIDKQIKSISVYQDLEELILTQSYKTFDSLYYKPDDYKKGISDLLKLSCSNEKIFDEYKNKINTELCGEVQSYIEGE